MAIGRDAFDEVSPGAEAAPDLDAWRTEAGEAAALANKATPGPWVAHNDGSLVSVADPAGPDLFEVLPHPRGAGEPLDFGPCKPNAAWAAAARTGWPRDAARVAALVAILSVDRFEGTAIRLTLGAWVPA